MAHRAGPGPFHVGKPDIALVHHTQRIQQLAAEKAGTATIEGERCQRRNYFRIPLDRAVAGLNAPDCDDEARLHAVPVRYAPQQAGMFRHHRPAPFDVPGFQQARAIGLESQLELRLLAIAVQDLFEWPEPRQRGIQRGR